MTFARVEEIEQGMPVLSEADAAEKKALERIEELLELDLCDIVVGEQYAPEGTWQDTRIMLGRPYGDAGGVMEACTLRRPTQVVHWLEGYMQGYSQGQAQGYGDGAADYMEEMEKEL